MKDRFETLGRSVMDELQQRQIFDDWLNQHKGVLFKITRAFAYNGQDQDDLFQEMSLQLWESVPNFRGEAKASTWVYRVALYTATIWMRQEKKRPPTQPLDSVEHTLMAKSEPFDERLRWLYEQIAQLAPVDRSVCLLLLDGFSYQEMAAILGISESNVGVKIHRIKKHLSRKSHEIAEPAPRN